MSQASGLNFRQLLAQARNGEIDAVGKMLQIYVHYLDILASTQLGNHLRKRVNSSDIVQDTLFAAYRDFAAFQGNSEREWKSWLRQILVHALHRLVDVHVRAEKRDVRRETPINSPHSSSTSQRVDGNQGLADREPTPSAAAQRQERALLLERQLAKLPEDYRQVIVERNLVGRSFDEIAALMGRTTPATRMLWLRAMEKLKAIGGS